MLDIALTSLDLLAAVNSVQRQFIAASEPHRAFDEALQHYLQLTGSELGIIGEVQDCTNGRPHWKLIATSERALNAAAEAADSSSPLDPGLEESLSEAIRTARPIIANVRPHNRRPAAAANDSPIESLFCLPIFGTANELVGIAGLANRPGGYDENLAATLEPLSTAIGAMIVAAQRDRQRRKSEDALRTSEARYQNFADHITDGLFLHDTDGRVVDVNRRACESLGYTRAELIGRLPLDFDPDVTHDQIRHHLSRLAQGESLSFDTRHRRKDGTTFPVEVRIRPLFTDGRTMHLALVCDITARKQAEDALREAQQRLKLILRGADIGMWDWDLVTNEVAFSREWKSQLGYSDEEKIDTYEDWRSRVHPDDLPASLEKIKTAIESKHEDYNTEFRMRHKDGSWRWLLSLGSVIVDDQGKPMRMLGVHVDITKRKQIEESMRISEQRYRLIADLSNSYSYQMTVSPDYQLAIPWVGGDIHGVTGYSAEEISGVKWLELIHPDDLPVVKGLIDGINVDPPQLKRDVELRIITRSGEVRWIRHLSHPISDVVPGKPTTFVGAVLDITDRKTAEVALRESESRLRTVLENLDRVAVQAYELDGTVTFWNKASELFYGYSADDALGKDIVELLHAEETRARERQIMLQAIQADEQLPAEELELLRRDGRKMTVFTSRIVHPRPGREPEFFCFDVDVTYRKQAEEELAIRQAELLHASRLTTVGRMVADLSHEVAQPLSAISNFAAASAEILENGSSEKYGILYDYVREIAKQNERCGAILHRMRDFTKRTSTPRTSCDVGQLLTDSVGLVANDFRRHEVRVRCSFAADMPAIRGDRVQLEQVFVNLLTNARDAVVRLPSERRTISIRGYSESNEVIVEVEDQGPGISAENAKRLFEPFFTTKTHGMGLGLNISHSIVTEHGGSIRVVTNDAGGATFRVSLPILPESDHG